MTSKITLIFNKLKRNLKMNHKNFKYDPSTDYYFVSYRTKKSPTHLRNPLCTGQEVQEHLNEFMSNSDYRDFKVYSEEDLNEVVIVDVETGKRLCPKEYLVYDEEQKKLVEDNPDRFVEWTEREYIFDSRYQQFYEDLTKESDEEKWKYYIESITDTERN